MKKVFVLLSFTLLIFTIITSTSVAQFAQKGQTELGGMISFSSTSTVVNGSTSGDPVSLFEAAPFVSYFISDGFSLGVSPNYLSIKSGGTTTSLLGLFAVPGFTFGKGDVYPFISAEVGYTSQSSSASGSATLGGLSYGAKGGVKVLVGGKNGMLNIAVSYRMITLNPSGADKRNGYNAFAITMGFSVFIGR